MVSGVILLAGTAQPGINVLLWQGQQVLSSLKGFQGWLLKVLPINPRKTQEKLFQKILNSKKDVMRVQLVVTINAKWMREFLVYKPAEDLPALNSLNSRCKYTIFYLFFPDFRISDIYCRAMEFIIW